MMTPFRVGYDPYDDMGTNFVPARATLASAAEDFGSADIGSLFALSIRAWVVFASLALIPVGATWAAGTPPNAQVKASAARPRFVSFSNHLSGANGSVFVGMPRKLAPTGQHENGTA